MQLVKPLGARRGWGGWRGLRPPSLSLCTLRATTPSTEEGGSVPGGRRDPAGDWDGKELVRARSYSASAIQGMRAVLQLLLGDTHTHTRLQRRWWWGLKRDFLWVLIRRREPK